MKYYRIVTNFRCDELGTLAFCDLEGYESENELINDIKLCLDNDKIAYVHYQEVTYKVFNRSEVKTMNDYSFGNNNQKLYTKDERYTRCTDYLTSYIV